MTWEYALEWIRGGRCGRFVCDESVVMVWSPRRFRVVRRQVGDWEPVDE